MSFSPMNDPWALFTMSGNPGFYLLYKNADDLMDIDGEGMTQEQREKR